MNLETALAHIETYIAGGDELGEVSDVDALAALETVRGALAASQQLLIRVEGYIHDKQNAWGTDPDDVVMLQRIDATLAAQDALQTSASAALPNSRD